MSATTERPQEALKCPSCGFHWTPPIAMPFIGYQPFIYRCPNRKCTQKHWLLVYKLTARAALRLRVHAVVTLLGRDRGSVRDSLRQVPDLDEDSIEFFLTVLFLKLERN